MFRFSIRELMLVTLVAAVGVAWTGERGRVANILAEIKLVKEEAKKEIEEAKKEIEEAKASNDADSLKRRCERLESAWQDSKKELERHGLALFNFCGHPGPGPILCKRRQDGVYVGVEIDADN